MERARTIFFALIALAVIIVLVVWIHTLDRRVDDLAAQVNELSGQQEGGGVPLVRRGEGGESGGRVVLPGMRRRGEGGPPAAPPTSATAGRKQ